MTTGAQAIKLIAPLPMLFWIFAPTKPLTIAPSKGKKTIQRMKSVCIGLSI